MARCITVALLVRRQARLWLGDALLDNLVALLMLVASRYYEHVRVPFDQFRIFFKESVGNSQGAGT